MNNSDILSLFARANEACGRGDYAKKLHDASTVYKAVEIVNETCHCKKVNHGKGWFLVQSGPDDYDKEICGCQDE